MKLVNRRSLLLTITLGALLFSGCSGSFSVGTSTKIDGGKAEEMVLNAFGGGKIKPEAVSCPEDVEAKKDETFDCDITFLDGAKGTVTVHMTSDDGEIVVNSDDLNITEPK